MFSSIADAKLKEGQTAIVRVDYNVPLDNNNKIKDPTKIKQSFSTINYLLRHKVKVILLSHLEHRGKASTLKPIYEYLKKKHSYLLFSDKIEKVNDNKIVLLENTRFLTGEKENSPELSKQLASMGDFFINDAFSVSHRKHASVVGISDFLPSFLGFSYFEEVEHLNKFFSEIKHPFVVIIGGAKWETKVPLVEKLSPLADYVLLGGIIAKQYQKSSEKNEKIIVPVDVDGLDINNETIKQYTAILAKAKTVLWNGPVGKYEEPKYRKGSLALLKTVAKNRSCRVVIGGGDTVAALKHSPYLRSIYYVTTAGGALLHYVANLKFKK